MALESWWWEGVESCVGGEKGTRMRDLEMQPP
jgi:hypothetical protein